MSNTALANDKYRATLRSTFIDGVDTILNVTAIPTNLPTIVTIGWNGIYQTVFRVEGTSGTNSSNYALTGISKIKGFVGNLPENLAVNCLNHEEYFNQFALKIDPFVFVKRTAPSAPAVNRGVMYLKLSDSKFYYKLEDGVEQSLIEVAVDPALLTEQGSTPTTPAANKMKLYPKTDNQMYTVDDTGLERIVGPRLDFWVPITDTLLFVNANQLRIASVNRTAIYKKGTRIKITQTTEKYFYVSEDSSMSGSDTIISVFAGTDFTVANAAITASSYSYIGRSPDFPTSFAFSMAPYGSTGSIGSFSQTSNSARFTWISGVVHVWAAGKVTNKGSWTGSVYNNLPIIPGSVTTAHNGRWLIEGGLNTIKAIAANVNSSPAAILQWNKTYLTAEFTWPDMAVNDCYQIELSYPA